MNLHTLSSKHHGKAYKSHWKLIIGFSAEKMLTLVLKDK